MSGNGLVEMANDEKAPMGRAVHNIVFQEISDRLFIWVVLFQGKFSLNLLCLNSIPFTKPLDFPHKKH